MRLQALQQTVDDWIHQHGVRYFSETTNMLLLTEEVGELARLISRVYGEQSFKRKEDEIIAQESIKEEMADILFVLTCLANQMDIDLEKAMQQNIEKKTKRDNQRHKENPKLTNQ